MFLCKFYSLHTFRSLCKTFDRTNNFHSRNFSAVKNLFACFFSAKQFRLRIPPALFCNENFFFHEFHFAKFPVPKILHVEKTSHQKFFIHEFGSLQKNSFTKFFFSEKITTNSFLCRKENSCNNFSFTNSVCAFCSLRKKIVQNSFRRKPKPHGARFASP